MDPIRHSVYETAIGSDSRNRGCWKIGRTEVIRGGKIPSRQRRKVFLPSFLLGNAVYKNSYYSFYISNKKREY
jgi:hypothetical protein